MRAGVLFTGFANAEFTRVGVDGRKNGAPAGRSGNCFLGDTR